ncbi:hypothetical protein [Streptomyces sp. NPDC001415]
MKVRCLRIINPTTGEEEKTSPWINVQNEYVVLELRMSPGRRISVRVESEEDGTPVLFDSEMFTTTSPEIPPHWVMRIQEDGLVEVGPRLWLAPGFWEGYFNQVPEAVQQYESELRKTHQYESMSQ